MYWYIDAGAPAGVKPGVQPAGRPVVFDLVADVSESKPLTPSSPEYVTAVKTAEQARVAHLATIEIVPDQNARGNDPQYAICGAPHSQRDYPQWPNCSLTPQFWEIPICGSPSTWWCNQTADGLCPNPENNHSCPGHGPPTPVPGPPPPPPGPPIPSNYYKGCYNDHQQEAGGKCDLPHIISGHCGKTKKHERWTKTVEGCNAMCQSFRFFGVQMGGTGCFCGNSYGSQGKAISDSMCNVTCKDNAHEICGGPNLNSVWAVRKN